MGPWALWLLGRTAVSWPEGVSGGLSEKLAAIGVLEGMFFREGYLVAGWHGANTGSFQTALFLPGPAELLHITLHTGKRPEALEAWRYKAPDRFIRKQEGALFI